MHKVLWVEDDARTSLARLAGPVYVTGKYLLEIASDVSTAIDYLSEKEYEVIIVDIRLPPGDDPQWVRCYLNGGGDKIRTRLGLQLIGSLLRDPNASVQLEESLDWITPAKIWVFTVESEAEIQADLRRYRIDGQYRHKRADLADFILLQIIELALSGSK
jgi:hypothetical protein